MFVHNSSEEENKDNLLTEILIMDEMLVLGDEAFHQRKSAARMREFREQGATILLVTHNMVTVQAMCQRVAWLDHGVVRALGLAGEVTEQYQQANL